MSRVCWSSFQNWLRTVTNWLCLNYINAKNLVWSCIAHSNSLGSIHPPCTLIAFYHDGVWKSETAWDSLRSLLMVFIQTLTFDSPVLLQWQNLPFSCWVQISGTSSWIPELDYDYPTKAHPSDAQQLLHLQNATSPLAECNFCTEAGQPAPTAHTTIQISCPSSAQELLHC